MDAAHDADREREPGEVLERHRDEQEDHEGRALEEGEEAELPERRRRDVRIGESNRHSGILSRRRP